MSMAALLAASALQGCGGMEKLNLLAAIDGPYISPAEREEMARREAELANAAVPALEVAPAAATAPAPEEEPAALVDAAETAPAALTARVTPARPDPVAILAEAPTAAAALAVAAPADTPSRPPAEVETRTQLAVVRGEPQLAELPAARGESAESDSARQLTAVGPGFLPPEIAAPSAPIPASVSTAFIGPVLGREEQVPARVEARLPSAFDYVAPDADAGIARRPAPQGNAAPVEVASLPQTATSELAEAAPPQRAALASAAQPAGLEDAASAAGYSVVSAMPALSAAQTERSAAVGSASSSYLGFYQFALAQLEETPAGGARQSMLLLDPPSLDPELQRCGNLPPAVLIDLDPANGLLPLVSDNRPNPELAGHLAQLRQRGVTIYWISGHAPNAAGRIRQRLKDSALDPDGIDPLIVTRFAGESKQARRYALGESHCLLAILGDHRGDFDELYDFVLDPIMAGPLEVHVGDGWFIAPPPLD